MTREMGKIIKETRGDVQEGIDYSGKLQKAQIDTIE